MTVRQLEDLLAACPRNRQILFRLGDTYVPVLYIKCRHIGYDTSKEDVIILSNAPDIHDTNSPQ